MANIKNFGIVGLGSDVQFGKGGAKLVQTAGTFAAKTADNAAFVRFAIANAVAADDAVTLAQLNAAVAASGANLSLLQGEVDRIETATGLNADGTYTAAAEGILATATSLKDADDKLAAALVAEAAARAAADSDLSNAVTAVDGRATAIQSELNASQASIGLNADGSLELADGNYLAGKETIVAAVEALDAAAKSAADAAAAAQADATAAQSDVDALDTRVTADIADLESNAAAQQALIDANTTKNADQDGRLTALETATGAALDAKFEAIEANAVAQQAEIDAAEAATTALTGRVATAESDINALKTRAGNIEANAVALSGRVDTVQSDLDTAEAAHAALAANAIVKDGSVAFTADQSMGGRALTNVATPVNAGDAANKSYVDGAVANLGNAFEYQGVLAGGEEGSATDLEASIIAGKREVGDYYKVTTAGYFKFGAEGDEFYFNLNDGLVFNTQGGFDKVDNTNSEVKGTVGQIAVSGSADTGFAVSIDGAYTAARQKEVTDEANARVAADAVLTTAVADVAADLADEVAARTAADAALQGELDGTQADLANAVAAYKAADTALGVRIEGVESDLAEEVAARQALATANTAKEAEQDGRLTALETAATADDSRLAALEAKDTVHEGLLSGLESNAAAQDVRLDDLEAKDTVHENRMTAIEADVTALEGNAVAQQTAIDGLDTRLDTAESNITALQSNAVAQQTAIDDLEDALENLSQDTITSLNKVYTVHAANTSADVASTEADTKLEIKLADGEVRMAAVSSEANADLRLVAQGTGQVIIGDEGVGIIQSDDNFDMTVAAGAGNQTLHLKGKKVAIESDAGVAIASFESAGSAKAKVSTTDAAVSFAAEGDAVDVDLVFDPKGAGRVDVSGAKVVNVADGVAATDAVNKGQLDAAVAASEVGHVVSKSVSVAATNGQVTIGAVTGMVTRVRVVVLTAYNTGATISVGTDALASDLVAAADVDETAAGVYIIETARDYAAANLVVTIAGATAGSAKVYVEYIKA